MSEEYSYQGGCNLEVGGCNLAIRGVQFRNRVGVILYGGVPCVMRVICL